MMGVLRLPDIDMVANTGQGTLICPECGGNKKIRESDRCRSCASKLRLLIPGVKEKINLSRKNPAYRASVSKRMKMMWTRPDYRERMVEKIRKATSDPSFREGQRLSRMGHPVSKETREKISKHAVGMRGRRLSLEHRAKISRARMGMQFSEEHKRKLREYHNRPEVKERCGNAHRGELNPNWNGGSSREPYSIEWDGRLQEQIRNRDLHLCQTPDCYAPELDEKHPVHHIDFHKKNNAPSNLITLCPKCHMTTTTGDRDYWTEFYQSLQEIRGIK